jgi:uncharacterized protein YcnI
MEASPRRARAALCAGLWLAATAGLAEAHVSVSPAETPVGITQRYGLLVPGEKPIPMTRVEVQFPAELRVAEVEPLPGWRAATQADLTGHVVGVVGDGGLIPYERSVEFGVRARNPERPTDLAWKFIQTYQDGSEVHWTGPPGSGFPATITRVGRRDGAIGAPMILAALAVVAALVGAVLAWRRRAAKG